MKLDLESGEISEFCQLPSALASQTSCFIDDRYICIYGGTNGMKFFDAVIRYDIFKREWNLMTKYPEKYKHSGFFKEGRLSPVSTTSYVPS